MEKYIIFRWYRGKFGYKNFLQLMQWNESYQHYYSIKDALDMEFIESYCIIHNIDFSSIKVQDKPKEK